MTRRLDLSGIRQTVLHLPMAAIHKPPNYTKAVFSIAPHVIAIWGYCPTLIGYGAPDHLPGHPGWWRLMFRPIPGTIIQMGRLQSYFKRIRADWSWSGNKDVMLAGLAVLRMSNFAYMSRADWLKEREAERLHQGSGSV